MIRDGITLDERYKIGGAPGDIRKALAKTFAAFSRDALFAALVAAKLATADSILVAINGSDSTTVDDCIRNGTLDVDVQDHGIEAHTIIDSDEDRGSRSPVGIAMAWNCNFDCPTTRVHLPPTHRCVVLRARAGVPTPAPPRSNPTPNAGQDTDSAHGSAHEMLTHGRKF